MLLDREFGQYLLGVAPIATSYAEADSSRIYSENAAMLQRAPIAPGYRQHPHGRNRPLPFGIRCDIPRASGASAPPAATIPK